MAGTGNYKPHLRWNPYVELNLRYGNHRDIGKIDVFMPLLQNEDTLLFADIRGMHDSKSALEGNFGLGIRHMYYPYMILGAYGFYDRRRSEFHNYYFQGTFGVEALMENYDFRFNYYLPEDNTYLFGSRTITEFGFKGNSFVQIVREQNDIYRERPLQGFDVEVGYQLPFFRDDYEGRVYLGYYHFKEATFPRLESPRLRYEQKVQDYITFEMESSRDNVRHWNNFAGVRLRIPLQEEKKYPRLSKLEKRMLTKVHRDIDLIIGSHENSSLSEKSYVISAKSINAAGDPVSDNEEEYIHVGGPVNDPTAPPGSYENPCPNLLCISTAVNLEGQSLDKAGVTIYVHENTDLSGSLVLKDGQKLIGTGCSLLANFKGSVYNIMPAGTHPTITQTAGSIITIANSNKVAGLHLKGGGVANGITGTDNSGGMVLCDLIVSDTVSAIDVSAASAIRAIQGITINNGGAGHGIKVTGIAGGVTMNSFKNVTISGHDTGLVFDRVTYLDSLGAANNIAINGASNAAVLDNSTITEVRGLITGGSMSATGSIIGAITGNNFSAAGGTALQLVNTTLTELSSNSVSASDNAISITGGSVGAFGGTQSLTANQNGIILKDIANLNSDVTGLAITGVGLGSTGIHLDNVHMQVGRSIHDNTLSNVGTGVDLVNGSTVPAIASNTITGAGGAATGIDVTNGSVTTIGGASAADTNVISNVQKAIVIPTTGSVGTIQHNTLTASLTGIEQQTGGLTTIADTLITAPTGISLDNAPNITFGSGNSITTTSAGISLANTPSFDANIAGLTITGSGGAATGIYVNNAALAAGRAITNNNISGVNQGIHITGLTSSVPTISKNVIQGNSGARGIYVENQANVGVIGGSNASEANSFADVGNAIELATSSTVTTLQHNSINGASINTGVLLDGTSQITTLQDNVIVASNDGIRVLGGSIITNLNQNTVTATNDGIDIQSANVNAIGSNTIISATNGMNISGSTVPSIQTNIIQAGTNGIIINSGSTSTTVANNDLTGTNKGIIVDGLGTSVVTMNNNLLKTYVKGIETTNGGSVTFCIGNLLNLIGLGCL